MKPRIAVALALVGALAGQWIAPARALPASAAVTPAANGVELLPPLDPRFVRLLKSRACGPATVRATPLPFEVAQTAGSGPPANAVASPAAAASPAATNVPPNGDTGNEGTGAQAPPAPTPSAFASAQGTFVPIPPVPPQGPSEIVPPTPRPTGSALLSPPPLPTATPSASASGPVFIVRPSGTPGPITGRGESPAPGAGASASASASPAASPSLLRTLAPNEVVTVADRLSGNSDRNQPSDLFGNVHIFYSEGQIVGDRAHYDGDHTIVVSGHAYLVNRVQSSILYADQIAFDTNTRHATLVGGTGETIEGVQRGKLHYTAKTLETASTGVSHGDRASFTTCENGHAGYHVEARSIDVTPGSKLVARKAVVFLGPTAIFYIPLLIIPLVEAGIEQRRQASFLPLIGYNQIEGYFIKLRLGFAPSNTYYGYYRVEYFTKRGLGLGYNAVIGAKDGHRYTTIDSYSINDRIQNARNTNVNIQDTENLTRRLRAQLGIQYQGDYGPALTLPATLNLTGSFVRSGPASTENVTFSRFVQGKLSDNLNLGFLDTLALSRAIQQQVNLTYARFNSPISSSNTFHIQSNTHAFTKLADFNLTYDKTDFNTNPFGYDRVPELQVLPHLNYGALKFGPQIQLTAGLYNEPQNHFNTTRFQGQFNESVYAKVLGGSDFSASYNLTQDYYGTGDAKAFDQQNASLSTPLFNHVVNAITYNEQHPIGPVNVPFQLFDRLSPASHSAQDVLRFYNKDVYSLQLATGTNFNRMAQPINYQLNVRPSLRSYLVFGGYFTPGSGNGFNSTNVQAITPFGKDTTLEFTTNIDWKNHNRLENKNVYLNKIVDNCYAIQAAYNQDLKQFTFNIVILAFPNNGAGFGFGGSGSSSPIIPQSFSF